MDGPHNLHTWPGADTIPGKLQNESVAWPEVWEGELNAIYALSSSLLYSAKGYNLDVARWLREAMHPRDYLNAPYFELWLRSLTAFFDQAQVATRQELTGVRTIPDPDGGGDLDVRITDPGSLDLAAAIRDQALDERIPGFLPQGGGRYAPDADHAYVEGEAASPRYRVGDTVRVVLQTGSGHTRQYPIFRGRTGVILSSYGIVKAQFEGSGARVFQPYYQSAHPDISCRHSPEQTATVQRQEFYLPVYNVRFEGQDLFGADYGEEALAVYADMFEPYLAFVSAANPGDLNGDGVVDRNDYNLFRAALGKRRGQAGYNERADYDGDGQVSLADYRTWYTYFRNA
jgi:hypothetical protein